MTCALLPVIAIEALVVRKRLLLSYGRAFGGAAKANVASTLAAVNDCATYESGILV
jgi:hypothetical protein